jgi:hypothetical protein
MDPIRDFGATPPAAARSELLAAMDPATLRRILNERFLLSRRIEREGLRRIFVASMLFIGVKFLRHKLIGKREDTNF